MVTEYRHQVSQWAFAHATSANFLNVEWRKLVLFIGDETQQPLLAGRCGR